MVNPSGGGRNGGHVVSVALDPDVAVIGAGPAGCATALAFARQGARVLLIEAQAAATRRLAGEWLHPSAVDVLRRLGIGPIPAATTHPAGRGFVVFPGNGEGPIPLHYSDGGQGLTCEHQHLVTALRSAAAAHPLVDFMSGVRLAGIRGQRLTLAREGRPETVTVLTDLIVGADGRASAARRALGYADDRRLISYMAGILLEDAELPFEGFGHVFLGGPGPAFVCRIGPGRVRVCLDVPLTYPRALRDPSALADAFSPALPRGLHVAFRRALNGPIAWVANQARPRTYYGRSGLALVGDAVGHFHPLTALGLAMSFQDAHCLAKSKSFADYRRQRAAASYVAEALAGSLYEMFTFTDDATLALRSAVFETWRQSPAECRLTMRLLSGAETNPGRFRRRFLKVLALACRRTLPHVVLAGHWGKMALSLYGFGPWRSGLGIHDRTGAPHSTRQARRLLKTG